jgi:hypothetical protein
MKSKIQTRLPSITRKLGSKKVPTLMSMARTAKNPESAQRRRAVNFLETPFLIKRCDK